MGSTSAKTLSAWHPELVRGNEVPLVGPIAIYQGCEDSDCFSLDDTGLVVGRFHEEASIDVRSSPTNKAA